eukprot:31772-Eustigmatos_ZCMA.PRE.1
MYKWHSRTVVEHLPHLVKYRHTSVSHSRCMSSDSSQHLLCTTEMQKTGHAPCTRTQEPITALCMDDRLSDPTFETWIVHETKGTTA